jgi:hypothetical protein
LASRMPEISFPTAIVTIAPETSGGHPNNRLDSLISSVSTTRTE